jgi:hypothetical protein
MNYLPRLRYLLGAAAGRGRADGLGRRCTNFNGRSFGERRAKGGHELGAVDDGLDMRGSFGLDVGDQSTGLGPDDRESGRH